MKQKKIIVIGNGKMAVDCIKYMLNFPETSLALVLLDPNKDQGNALEKFCSSQNITSVRVNKLNIQQNIEAVKNASPEFIFSINNYKIIGDELLNIPHIGTINFHNGPLPLYGGVNIPSWAIINGEKKHGVTWHFVDSGIDTGDIIGQSSFEIEDDSTAARLMTVSILEGFKLFKDIYPNLLNGSFSRIPQSGKTSYFSLKHLPPNNGIIDFSDPYSKISALVRGLNFMPFPNTFVYPKIKTHYGEVIVNEISKISDDTATYSPGSIVEINSQFIAACADGLISINDMMSEDQDEITPLAASEILKVKAGDKL